ncbi:MAG: hypothetical protein ACOZAM_09875 [Pseudomonadota bacterium]|jgi:hypothetical protein
MIRHDCSSEQILAERNKRLLAWTADALNLDASERPRFYAETSKVIDGIADDELAELLYDRLPPQVLINGVEDARKLIRHFHDIAASWLQECKR